MNVTNPHSDALVFFGATGDLAYKKIFPALQAMLNRGHHKPGLQKDIPGAAGDAKARSPQCSGRGCR
jgi:glucose-6-phosphate 1-dehydrogenase